MTSRSTRGYSYPTALISTLKTTEKKQFYRDIKSNIRLITPVYLMREIAQDSSLPLVSLTRALENIVGNPSQENLDAYEYHLKMFAAIFKSALRDLAAHISSVRCLESAEYLVDDYTRNSMLVLEKFRALYQIIDVPTVTEKTRGLFRLCDEFMSHVVELRTIRIIKTIDEKADSPMHTKIRKKFIESELYISLDKKKDGVAVQQIYYSIAAGVAMIFATAVAWFSQVKYGNITWPLFIVLVVSYMLKDRIKDLLRYYFAHRLGNKYYDKKAVITIGKNCVGEIKEGFDFISEAKTPAEVLNKREKASFVEDESRIFEEKVLLYRKRVTIDNAALAANDDYPMRGINEIMRLHLNRLTHKMDNPEVPIDSIDGNGNIQLHKVEKIYYVNIVFQLQYDEVAEYHHFRISMSRNGVIDIIQI